MLNSCSTHHQVRKQCWPLVVRRRNDYNVRTGSVKNGFSVSNERPRNGLVQQPKILLRSPARFLERHKTRTRVWGWLVLERPFARRETEARLPVTKLKLSATSHQGHTAPKRWLFSSSIPQKWPSVTRVKTGHYTPQVTFLLKINPQTYRGCAIPTMITVFRLMPSLESDKMTGRLRNRIGLDAHLSAVCRILPKPQ